MSRYPFTPELLDALPEELAKLFRGLEDTLLDEICSRLALKDQLNEVTVQAIRALRSHGIDTKEIEKAIILADLGFTPLNDGTCIRCNIPQLTGETRNRLVKDCLKMAEDAKVAVRNIRRDAISELKKDKTIPEDTLKNLEEEVQKLTDNSCKRIDELAKAKEKELTTI